MQASSDVVVDSHDDSGSYLVSAQIYGIQGWTTIPMLTLFLYIVNQLQPMLSSILFQDLSEKASSFESVTQHEGFIHMPDDLNEHSLEEEELVGREGEEDAFKVRYVRRR